MPRAWPHVMFRSALFVAVYVGSAELLQGQYLFKQAMLWLPTGVAIAGLWWLGAAYWPVVALGTITQRLIAGYTWPNLFPSVIGNTLEAVLGVALLSRLGFQPECRRLKDVLALLACAAVAPIPSALVGRARFLVLPSEISFLSGLTGWWRMNALGILVVVPLVLSWTNGPRPRPKLRDLIEIVALSVAIAALVWFLISIDTESRQSGMVLSYLALPVALFAALRFGVRGAATAGAAMVVALTLGTVRGIGPFFADPSQPTPDQVRELAFQAVIAIIMATPMLLGAAIADREAALAEVARERKRLEDHLRQSQKLEALGKLAGGVAHDFNNLLTVIMGFAETLRSSLPPNSEARRDAERISSASERGANLTRQLLAYSRRQRLELETVDLDAVVDQMMRMLRPTIGENILLAPRTAGAQAWVRVDRGQVEQVILNLVLNARDAMPSGGTLTIATELAESVPDASRVDRETGPGPYVRLDVRDTGVGMDTRVVSRAFDPFFTTKEPGKGTGLGLSTVHGIVHQSGGAVWIDSAPGAGTVVHVAFPRVDAPRTRELEHSPAESGHPGHATVLVVEDESAVRSLISRTLRSVGYRVIEAADGVLGLEMARGAGTSIDLVVTDVLMPRMGGRDLIAALAATCPGARALFVSGYPSEALDPSLLPELGAEYLQKPFTPQALLERVAACFAREVAPIR